MGVFARGTCDVGARGGMVGWLAGGWPELAGGPGTGGPDGRDGLGGVPGPIWENGSDLPELLMAGL